MDKIDLKTLNFVLSLIEGTVDTINDPEFNNYSGKILTNVDIINDTDIVIKTDEMGFTHIDIVYKNTNKTKMSNLKMTGIGAENYSNFCFCLTIN